MVDVLKKHFNLKHQSGNVSGVDTGTVVVPFEDPNAPAGAQGAQGEQPQVPSGSQGEQPQVPSGSQGEQPQVPSGHKENNHKFQQAHKNLYQDNKEINHRENKHLLTNLVKRKMLEMNI